MKSLKNTISNTASILALTVLGLASMTGCGSGGGDGTYIGAAVISVNTAPHKIDTGDRTLVTTYISQVHKNGIALKVLFPEGLVYVPSSARIVVQGGESKITPTENKSGDDGNYLVFYLRQNEFGSEGKSSGELVLELEGLDTVSKNQIAVDADVDDPLVENDVEFDIENPQFSAESSTDIEVKG